MTELPLSIVNGGAVLDQSRHGVVRNEAAVARHLVE